MTRSTPLHALALAAAALAFGTPAEAGGGVRLTFGGPLPSFVATPTPGYGGGSAAASRKTAPKFHAAKRRQQTPTVVSARHHSKAERPIVQARHTSPSSAPKVVPTLPVTANDGENPGFIGRALALDSLPRAETVQAVLPSETIIAVEAPDMQTAAAGTPATCRKFIPAVGVTVTVACD